MRASFLSLAGSCALLAGLLASPAHAEERTAVFAGGCFWSVEKMFDTVPGVTRTTSGFSGGKAVNPTYRQVIGGGTGHVEAVEVAYDPARVGYAQLLDAFWHSIDPTDPSGQFCDKGAQYETVVFVADAAEKAAAEASRVAVAAALSAPVSTRIEDAAPFYAAEDEHQDFHLRNAAHYQRYAIGCGRAASLAVVWGDRAYAGAGTTG